MTRRVVLADDHPAFALGMRLALENEGYDVVAVARDGRESVDLCGAHRPDVVILDVRMPTLNGTDACREILASVPADAAPPLVVMLSTYDDAVTLRAAYDAGARAYFTKEASPASIVRTVEELLASRALNLITPPPLPKLTEREFHVLEGLGLGRSNKQIAAQLGVGVETVKDHCSALFGKLGVRDRAHAVIVARRLGLLES